MSNVSLNTIIIIYQVYTGVHTNKIIHPGTTSTKFGGSSFPPKPHEIPMKPLLLDLAAHMLVPPEMEDEEEKQKHEQKKQNVLEKVGGIFGGLWGKK